VTPPKWFRRAVIVAVAAALSFFLVSRLGSDEDLEARLRTASEADLARILSGLNTESDLLREELSALRLQLRELETSTERGQAAESAAAARLEALSVLAGTVPVQGPGIIVTVTDPEEVVGYEDLLDAVQEVRDAGAEAVAINGLRVGAASAFSGEDGRVLLDGRPLRPPYRLEVIGDAGTLQGGLDIPGGVVDSLTSQPKVEVDVGRRSRLELPALLRHPTFQVAEVAT
jgi:uncharacterized protein YlxW (UPF0749 family)